MAKNTTTINKDPMASYTSGQKSSLPRAVVDKMKGKSSLPQSVVDRMKGKRDLEVAKAKIGVNANRYRMPIGPSNKGTVPGGAGITALTGTRMKPTAKAPKATVSGSTIMPASAPVRKPTEITIPGGGLKTAKATPAASKTISSRSSGSGLGVTTGKTTGSSATRAGTGGRTGGRGNAGPAGMGASGRGTGGKR